MAIAPTPEFEASNALAHAIVDTVREPFLVLDKDLKVIVANRSFYRTFQVDREHTEGRLLHELGDRQWDIPSLRVFLKRVASEDGVVEAHEVEQTFPLIGHRIMCLNGRKIVVDDSPGGGAILIAIEDVTERVTAERERDELLRQKDHARSRRSERGHRKGNW